jgi:TrmH family RNA methyltransferase
VVRAEVREQWRVSPQVLEKVSGLKSPPPLVAVLDLPEATIDFRRCRVTVGLIDVQDPGNLGTVFRCASAFGASALALAGDCARPNHPRVIRAAQTALFDVPFQAFPGSDELVAAALDAGARVYVTGSRPGRASLSLAALQFPCLLLFGNEGRGLAPGLLERFPLVRLEQEERIDSLNVAVSACILLHELRRLHGP